MKSQTPLIVSPVRRLDDWIQTPSPPCTLVLGAACSCDLPQIERTVCGLLNRVRELRGYQFSWLDYEDVRFLSGQPELRRAITTRAGIGGDRYLRWNDSELVLRGLASMGGLVLGGQAALDATHDLPNVCRMMLCNCRFCDELDLHDTVNPELCAPEQLPVEVMRRFLDWMVEHPYGIETASPAAAELGRMKQTLQRDRALQLA